MWKSSLQSQVAFFPNDKRILHCMNALRQKSEKVTILYNVFRNLTFILFSGFFSSQCTHTHTIYKIQSTLSAVPRINFMNDDLAEIRDIRLFFFFLYSIMYNLYSKCSEKILFLFAFGTSVICHALNSLCRYSQQSLLGNEFILFFGILWNWMGWSCIW